MAIRDIFKVSRKTFLNPSGWFNLDLFISCNKTLWGVLKSGCMPIRSMQQETFEEATQRLNLTKSDIENAEMYYRGFAYVFFSLGIMLLVFGATLFFYYVTFHGFLLSIAAALLFFSQAFKYHFCYFQIKSHKLGCAWQEWFQSLFKSRSRIS